MTSLPARSVRRATAVGTLAAAVLVVSGLVAYRMKGDVPRGTSVLGVDLGGLSRTEAEETLRGGLTGWAPGPARVRVDGRYAEVPPAAAGMSVDVDLSVGRAIREGPGQVVPVVRVDKAALVVALLRRIGPAAGRRLDPDRTAWAVKKTWPAGGVAEVPLVPAPNWQRTPRLHTGRVARHPQRWPGGRARRVQPALRSRATKRVRREAAEVLVPGRTHDEAALVPAGGAGGGVVRDQRGRPPDHPVRL